MSSDSSHGSKLVNRSCIVVALYSSSSIDPVIFNRLYLGHISYSERLQTLFAMSDTPFDDPKPAFKAPSDILDPPAVARDVESSKEIAGEVDLKQNPRKDIPTWKWILSLIGLYLGALLVGTYDLATSPSFLYDSWLNHCQVSTPPSQQMFRRPSMKPSATSKTYPGSVSDSQWPLSHPFFFSYEPTVCLISRS